MKIPAFLIGVEEIEDDFAFRRDLERAALRTAGHQDGPVPQPLVPPVADKDTEVPGSYVTVSGSSVKSIVCGEGSIDIRVVAEPV